MIVDLYNSAKSSLEEIRKTTLGNTNEKTENLQKSKLWKLILSGIFQNGRG